MKDYKDIFRIISGFILLILAITDWYGLFTIYLLIILSIELIIRIQKQNRRRNKRLSRQRAKETGEYVAPIQSVQNDESSFYQSDEIQKGNLFNFFKFYFFYFFSNKDRFVSTTIDNRRIHYNKKGERLFIELFITLLICTLIGVTIFYFEDDLLLQKVWYGLDVITCTIAYVFYIWKMKVQIN